MIIGKRSKTQILMLILPSIFNRYGKLQTNYSLSQGWDRTLQDSLYLLTIIIHHKVR
jgi:hypothetical protein